MAPHQPSTELDQAAARLKRARQTQRLFPQREQAIDKELKELQERTRWLNTLKKLNRGQHNEWLSSVNNRSIVPYCQTWNLRFAEEMQKRLPVELRNIIYRHLWDKETVTVFPDLSRVAGGSKCMEKHCSCSRPHKTPHLPHFVKSEYIGLGTAREIVRALYDAFHTKVNGLTVRAPEHIKSAVSKDMFQVGLDPGLHLRSLNLRIKLDRLRLPRVHHVPTSNCQHTDVEKVYTNGPQLKAWLNALKCIVFNAGFELSIFLYQRNIRLAVIEEVLSHLAGIRRFLQARQMAITIDWVYRGQWEKGIESTTAEYDLVDSMDAFYDMPRKAWRLYLLDTLITAEDDGAIRGKHIRFYGEPCQHVSTRAFVHAMWDDSEDGHTTDGEEEDQECNESSDDEESGNSDENEDNDDDDASYKVQTYEDLIESESGDEVEDHEDVHCH